MTRIIFMAYAFVYIRMQPNVLYFYSIRIRLHSSAFAYVTYDDLGVRETETETETETGEMLEASWKLLQTRLLIHSFFCHIPAVVFCLMRLSLLTKDPTLLFISRNQIQKVCLLIHTHDADREREEHETERSLICSLLFTHTHTLSFYVSFSYPIQSNNCMSLCTSFNSSFQSLPCKSFLVEFIYSFYCVKNRRNPGQFLGNIHSI